MKQRIKRVSILGLCLLFSVLVFIPVPVHASGEQRVYDKADLFSDAEEIQLESEIQTLKSTLPLDIVIVTILDSEGKSSRDYADDFYDTNGFGVGSNYDGILLLIDMDNREAYISTSGAAIDYFTDLRINSILDDVVSHLQDKAYAEAGMAFLKAVRKYMEAGVPKGQYRVDENEIGEHEPGQSKENRFAKSLARTPAYLVIAVSIAAITVGIMVFFNQGISQTNQYTYLDKNSMHLVRSFDRHVHTHISKVKINTSSGGGGTSSGGRSTTHRSSSGRVHGGGGRKF